MKVKFLVDCEIEIFENYDEVFDDGETTCEVFKIDDIVEFDIIGAPLVFTDGGFVPSANIINVQFGDGSVALGISTDWFTKI